MYTLKTLPVKVTPLAGAQQEQSTLQNTETWNTRCSKKEICSKGFLGCLMNPTLFRLSKVHHH